MDFNKEFEKYLPIWSEQKHLPIPTKNHPDKWNEAWVDFLSEYLVDKYDEINNEYKNMALKGFETYSEPINPIAPPPEPEIEEKPVKKSNWELVQEKRKKKWLIKFTEIKEKVNKIVDFFIILFYNKDVNNKRSIQWAKTHSNSVI